MAKSLLFLITLFLTQNCKSQNILLSLVTDRNIEKKMLIYENENGKKLIFLPTVHVGKLEYYESIKKVVDSYRESNYLIAYEGIIFDLKSQLYEENAKKLRKILGYNIANISTEYSNTLPSAYSNKKYISQNNTLLGIDADIDAKFDIKLDLLISKYEKKYGSIMLNECDIETALSQKYICTTDKEKYCKYCVTDEFRNEYVINLINENKNKNMVLLFGKGHKFFLHAGILNNGYKLVGGKL